MLSFSYSISYFINGKIIKIQYYISVTIFSAGYSSSTYMVQLVILYKEKLKRYNPFRARTHATELELTTVHVEYEDIKV